MIITPCPESSRGRFFCVVSGERATPTARLTFCHVAGFTNIGRPSHGPLCSSRIAQRQGDSTMVAARTWPHLLAGLAIAGVVLPPQQLAAAEVIGGAHGAAVAAVARAPIGDVELGRGGLLVGRLVDTTGRPVAGRDVSVVVGDKTIAVSRTDGSGVFAVAGLRGGVHQITTVESARVCRLWAPGPAPPQTPPSLELVAA